MNAHVFQRKSGVAVTDEVQAEIARMYQAGAKRQELRDLFRCGNSTITSALDKYAVDQRRTRVIHDHGAEQRVVALYKAGAERKAIVERTGVPNSTITHILKRNGIERDHVRRPAIPNGTVDAVCRLYREGLSYTEIGDKLGISRNSAAGIIHRKKPERSVEMSEANNRRAAAARATKPKSAPKSKLVAVASKNNDRVLMVPEEDAHKYESREEAPNVVTSANDPVLKLKALDCRWPIGEVNEQGFHFCCAKRSGSGPYCEGHTTIATSGRTMSTKEFIRSLRRFAA